MSGKVVRTEESDNKELENEIDIRAAVLRGSKKAETGERWEDLQRTLKERIRKERKMAAPKVSCAGNWKKLSVGVVDVVDEPDNTIDVAEIDIDKEHTEVLKKTGPRVARRVEKHTDVIKTTANPIELINKILDNEPKGATATTIPSNVKPKTDEKTMRIQSALLETPFIVCFRNYWVSLLRAHGL
ncbi:hypothetical protein ACMFMG_005073 [Clarireedia jacksonii]